MKKRAAEKIERMAASAAVQADRLHKRASRTHSRAKRLHEKIKATHKGVIKVRREARRR